MKLLRNPIVVSILAIIAVVMVLYQVLGDRLLRGRLFRPKPATAAATSVPAKPAATPAQAATAPKPASLPPKRAATYTNLEAALLPSLRVEATQVEQRFSSWVSAPLRDPFLILSPAVHESSLLNADTNSPVPTWALRGIWNQTDNRLAVINGRIWRVGEVIEEGYKLIRIEQDEVWIEGPVRNERLGFAEPKQSTPKPPPPSPQPPHGESRT